VGGWHWSAAVTGACAFTGFVLAAFIGRASARVDR
jgi:hypothetical protein